MKKIIAAIALSVSMVACGETTDKNTDTRNTPAQTAATEPAGGLGLIMKSDCLGCHKVDERLIGPAYIEVAKKYPDTDSSITMLAGKIINGGAGNWGEVPMAPHPTITKSDAEEMAKYILALNN